MDRALWLITVPIALAFICSCATEEPYTYEIRKHSTGIGADEGVVILLSSSRFNDKSIESEGEEKSIADCVKTGMMKANPRLKSVSATDSRRMVFPNKGFLDSPRSPEELLSFLSDPEAKSRVMGLGVRYVIVVTANISELKKDVQTHVDGGGLAVGRDFSRNLSSDATVLDIKYLRKSGEVHAGCFGHGFWFVGCVGGPCPIPVAWLRSLCSEAETCSAFGEALMKFLIDGHDIVPTTESGTGIDSEGRKPDTQTVPQPASEEDGPKGTYD